MNNKLFMPFDLAGTALKNRIVMAPMTRARAERDIADERVALYYAQRATAGLIITEGTPISREGQGYLFNPGIYSEEHINGWKLTTDSVHCVGGKIFAQLWHVGRVSHPSVQGGAKIPVSATSKAAVGAKVYGYDGDGQPGLVDTPAPRQLTTEEVRRVVRDYAKAAENAMAAGFDGVEIHGANGYLLEQFMNPLVNDRADQYAGHSMAGRLRFTLEVIDAVCESIGHAKVGIRLSPYGRLFDMPHYAQIDETYTTLADEIGRRRLAFAHLMNQSGFKRADRGAEAMDDNGFFALMKQMKDRLPHTALILAGGMTRARAEDGLTQGTIDLAAFGASYISNPDLVARLENNWPLTAPVQDTFYGGGAAGYIDYPPYNPTL